MLERFEIVKLETNPKFGTLKLHHSICVFSEQCTALKVLSYIAILQRSQPIEKDESPEEFFSPLIKPIGS